MPSRICAIPSANSPCWAIASPRKTLPIGTIIRRALLLAIVDHSLTDLAHGIWFAAQLMQAACAPQCNTKGEGMRERFRQREPVAAPRQRSLRSSRVDLAKAIQRRGRTCLDRGRNTCKSGDGRVRARTERCPPRRAAAQRETPPRSRAYSSRDDAPRSGSRGCPLAQLVQGCDAHRHEPFSGRRRSCGTDHCRAAR